MEQSLFIELIKRTKGVLGTIHKLTQLSRGKFGDRDFGDFFYRAITQDIEKHHLLLNTFLKYIESTTPIPKKDTVSRLIGEVIKKYQVQLEARKIRILRNIEKDLPETILPDEQLRFILESLLQQTMVLTPSEGSIEFLSKSVVLPGGTNEDKKALERHGNYVEIVIVFAGYKKPIEQPGKGLEVRSPTEEALSDLVYKLVDRIVKKNQGVMKFEVDERGPTNVISLKFPVERRKIVCYQLTNE